MPVTPDKSKKKKSSSKRKKGIIAASIGGLALVAGILVLVIFVIKPEKTFTKGEIVYRILNEYEVSISEASNYKRALVDLTDVIIYGGVQYKIVRVDKKAFYDNDNIKVLLIGKDVGSIGYKAFAECDSLTQIKVEDPYNLLIKRLAFDGVYKDGIVSIKMPEGSYSNDWKVQDTIFNQSGFNDGDVSFYSSNYDSYIYNKSFLTTDPDTLILPEGTTGRVIVKIENLTAVGRKFAWIVEEGLNVEYSWYENIGIIVFDISNTEMKQNGSYIKVLTYSSDVNYNLNCYDNMLCIRIKGE